MSIGERNVGTAGVLTGGISDLGVVHIVITAGAAVAASIPRILLRVRRDDRIDVCHRLGTPAPVPTAIDTNVWRSAVRARTVYGLVPAIVAGLKRGQGLRWI